MKRKATQDPAPEGSEESQRRKRRRIAAPNFKVNFPKRLRAHANPLGDLPFAYPTHPSEIRWEDYYPGLESYPDPVVRFLDVGCAFGGLLCTLSTIYPETLMLGMELRRKAVEYTQGRIVQLRRDNAPASNSLPYRYTNIWVVQNNVMKHLPNYIKKSQLTKMFFCFPDPHFKKRNERKRIISRTLLDEYAYVLQDGGILYTVTDVEELGDWMMAALEAHPLFIRICDEELDADDIMEYVLNSSEDAQRTTRNDLTKYISVYRVAKDYC